LYLKCLIDDSINFRYSIEASTNDNIILYEIQEDKNGVIAEKNILFNGIIQNIRTTNIDGVHYLEIEALTSSSLLDIQEKSRSFQDEKMSYDDLINEILEDYLGFGFAQCMSMPKRIEKPLFQYKETDYEFLKRIASQLGLELISDIINLTNMFYFGKPTGKSYIVNDDVNYNAVKDLDKYHKISALNGNLHDTDYFYYEVYLRESLKIGDSIKFKNIDFYINQYKAEYIKGELIYKYRFCRPNGIWQENIYNKKLSGISLEGTVIETTGEILKLKLNIDEKQDINKAAWFKFAPPTGNILYSMPLVGDNVMLYFQNEYDRPVVTGCVRKNGATFGRCANPNNRYYATESGNHLDMLPGAINFYRGGMNVSFNDENGISFSSNNNLNIGTQGSISMSAGNVSISGSNKVIVSKGKGGFISLEGELYNEATAVFENGSCRQPYGAWNDDIPNLGELLRLRSEIQLNKFNPSGNAIASAVAGNQAKVGECYITQDSGNSIPIDSVKNFSSSAQYKPGEPVKVKGTDGNTYFGTAEEDGYIGTGAYKKYKFVPYNREEYNKGMSVENTDFYKFCNNNIVREITSFVVGFTPIDVGVDAISFIAGKDIVTGEKCSRAVLVACIIAPGVLDTGLKQAAKHSDDVGEFIVKNSDDIIDASKKGTNGAGDAVGESQSKTLVNGLEQFTNGRKNKLKPNIRYKTGEFDYYYETDGLGRIEKFETDNLQLTDRTERLNHSKNTQGKVKGEDDAGHLIGDRFGGSPKIDNLVSQLSNVNKSQYKKIENKWAKAIDEGKNVKIDAEIKYDGNNLRPSGFDVKYEIDGKSYRQSLSN